MAARAQADRGVIVERSVVCKADVCSMWNVLTDTERLNRAVGMDKVELAPLSNGTAARYLATTRLGGFLVQYEERPYEWVYLKSFKVLRKMRSGPVESLEMSYVLDEATRGGTDVHLKLTMVPRLRILTPFIKLRAAQTLKRFEREVERLDVVLETRGPPRAASPLGALHTGMLQRAADKLHEVADKDLTDRLVTYVSEAGDVEVSRIRPFALADEWHVDRRELLAVCLRAVGAGLLDLRWEVVCPSCRTAADTLPTLSALTDHGTCQLCELSFSLDLDEAVEATFAPTRAVREVDPGPYCIGGPARTPHVVAQIILPPHGSARLPAPDETGRYRLFVRGGSATGVEVAKDAPTELAVRDDALDADEVLRVAPGGTIAIDNPRDDELHAKVERVSWSRQAATAREVTAMPGFRRDFSSDVLRPGTALRVSRVGLFFSDLTASTQLYSTVGDATAFKLVQDHFDVVFDIVEKHHGTLVKTIGDAVMAVFADEMDGLKAGLAVLLAFEDFRKQNPDRARTHIKLGIFAGPCYAVTANKILDYFGQTVNVAARLQGEAGSGELVVEESLADQAIAAGVVPAQLVCERYDAKLKGVDGPVRAARIRVTSG